MHDGNGHVCCALWIPPQSITIAEVGALPAPLLFARPCFKLVDKAANFSLTLSILLTSVFLLGALDLSSSPALLHVSTCASSRLSSFTSSVCAPNCSLL